MDANIKGIPINDDEFNIELLPEEFAQYDICHKIIVIGDSGVGKSCLTTQAVRNNFDFSSWSDWRKCNFLYSHD